MSSLLNKIFSKNKDLPWQTFRDETIIVDPQSQNSFELNEVGSFIWNRMDGKTTVAQIQEKICQEFDVSQEVVTEDLISVVNEMKNNGLLKET